MTPAEARAILTRITYKHGRRFSMKEHGMHWLLFMHADLDDAVKPNERISLHFSKLINAYDLPLWKEYDLLQHVKRLCAYAEDHEIKEWLKLDGKCIDEPHPELRQQPLSPLQALQEPEPLQPR